MALHREGIEPLSRTGDAFRSNQGFNKYGINKGVNKGVGS